MSHYKRLQSTRYFLPDLGFLNVEEETQRHKSVEISMVVESAWPAAAGSSQTVPLEYEFGCYLLASLAGILPIIGAKVLNLLIESVHNIIVL